jgi:hypothetical protein
MVTVEENTYKITEAGSGVKSDNDTVSRNNVIAQSKKLVPWVSLDIMISV